MAAQGSQRILLGVVTGAHGIRGEVLIRTFTEAPENIGAYGPLSDVGGARPLKLKVLRVTPKGVIARISGVDDRNGAEALKGAELYVARSQLPAAREDEGEFYYSDLVGLEAVDVEGVRLGSVVAVQNYGAGDLLEVRLAGSSVTELIPFRDAFVPTVDIAAGRVVVILPVASEDDAGPENGPEEDQGPPKTR